MEKAAVHIGIVNKITSLNSKFGHSWAIELDHGTRYYLNGKSEDLAEKLFEVGKKKQLLRQKKNQAKIKYIT